MHINFARLKHDLFIRCVQWLLLRVAEVILDEVYSRIRSIILTTRCLSTRVWFIYYVGVCIYIYRAKENEVINSFLTLANTYKYF